jgi:Effector Associated Constant Component 1
LILISVPGGAAELQELAQWLEQYEGLAGRVTAPPGERRPGQLGPGLDALAIAVGSGGALTVLARGLVAWASSYRSQRGSDVYVHASRPGGAELTVVLRNVTDAEAVLKQALEQAGGEG